MGGDENIPRKLVSNRLSLQNTFYYEAANCNKHTIFFTLEVWCCFIKYKECLLLFTFSDYVVSIWNVGSLVLGGLMISLEYVKYIMEYGIQRE